MKMFRSKYSKNLERSRLAMNLQGFAPLFLSDPLVLVSYGVHKIHKKRTQNLLVHTQYGCDAVT